ncbi:LysR family transcriptional regulator [Novosphingobium sp. G106]|uniref:winged helix-turn-helix domain-containing protein n=1 Tax=Novosphingobium sp. G106 TaxID=2849500 RepID=UPI001C2D2F39|nr:LysR family transcriptional regulator [Novosphingobium sp. G106]MBV1691691.1 LysR family transcriptional regulator [Novosphingobium sp. G106]
MADEAILKLKVQLYSGEEIAMGPGKADLLEAIRAHGSISAAGRAMGMSYRRAWLLVDAMNRCWQRPLVETSPGSAHGGGARVSAFGETVLTHYRALQARIDAAADCADFAALQAGILPEPRSSQKA